MKTNNQQGRSMVEMLGTLAIMGILSVGAITGYSYAFTKYKTNTLINDLNVRALVVSQQRLAKEAANLFEFKDTLLFPITIENFTPDSDNYFGLQAANIDKQVCENVMINLPSGVNGIYQNNRLLKNASDCLDETTLLFVYANDLNLNTAFATNDTFACNEQCSSGTTNPTCAPNEKQKDTGTTACGVICAICLNDECASGTSTACSSDLTPSPAGTTDYGTQCYTCN